jgi:LPS sulfotransferase NodH
VKGAGASVSAPEREGAEPEAHAESAETGPRAPTPFVVFTTQRSGSTWVMSVLNTYEDVTGQGELFLRRPRSPERRWDSDFAHSRYVESKAEYGRVRPFSTFRYLDAFFAQGPHVGFKLMYDQLRSYPEILVHLLRRRVRVVHLVRENHLDVLISFALKREIGKAHMLDAKDRPQEPSVELPTASLLRQIRWLQLKHDAARHLLRASRLRHLEVTYEQLVRDPSRYEEILAFLGVSTTGETPRSHILKTRVGGQRDVVSNYDEVARVLAGTRFASLLE